jgi:hypothetical protein
MEAVLVFLFASIAYASFQAGRRTEAEQSNELPERLVTSLEGINEDMIKLSALQERLMVRLEKDAR